MNRGTRHFTALMLALTLGLHWTVLQSVAWMTMLVNYTVESSFGEAVAKTFDGRHPCKLCIAVNEGKQSEREQKQLKSLDKADWILVSEAIVLAPPDFDFPRPQVLGVPDSCPLPPPTPPPRRFLG
jgi:hypothetical protein